MFDGVCPGPYRENMLLVKWFMGNYIRFMSGGLYIFCLVKRILTSLSAFSLMFVQTVSLENYAVANRYEFIFLVFKTVFYSKAELLL